MKHGTVKSVPASVATLRSMDSAGPAIQTRLTMERIASVIMDSSEMLTNVSHATPVVVNAQVQRPTSV